MNQHWKNVRSNQVNNSSSKSTYAFSKQQRFQSQKNLCDSFYNLPAYMGKTRASGIGKGSKMTFGAHNKVPAPNKYQMQSTFDQKNKGIKFSLGRQKVKYGSIFLQTQTPQPSRYKITNGKLSNTAFSMRKKLQPLQPSYKINPGPGNYNALSMMSSSGKYTLSHVKNCSVPKIKNMKEYDENLYRKTPGPGAYNQHKQNMNSSGLYFNSKYSDSRCRSFSKTSRKDIVPATKKRLPGPGQYNFFSEFGCK